MCGNGGTSTKPARIGRIGPKVLIEQIGDSLRTSFPLGCGKAPFGPRSHQPGGAHEARYSFVMAPYALCAQLRMDSWAAIAPRGGV